MLNISKGNHKRFKPDLAPLIDVVFLLLIFYMLTFAIPGQGLDVKLPQGSSFHDDNEKPLSIRISLENSIRVGEKTTNLQGLEALLISEFAIRPNKTVIVQSDDKIKYDTFIRVFDLARRAGAQSFSLVM